MSAAAGVAFSPDGLTLAATGVAFDADGMPLASTRDDVVARLWDVQDPSAPEPMTSLKAHAFPVTAVAFSPDNHTLAALSDDDTIRLWDVSDTLSVEPSIGSFKGTARDPDGLAFSPDSSTVFVSSDRDGLGVPSAPVELVDVTNRTDPQPMSSLPGSTYAVQNVAYSPGGRFLATGSADGTVGLLNVITPLAASVSALPSGETVQRALTNTTSYQLVAPAAQMTAVGPAEARSPDGHLLAIASPDGSLKLSALAGSRQQPVASYTGHAETRTGLALNWMDYPIVATAAAFSPDGHTLATTSDDGRAVLWDVSNPAKPRQLSAIDFFPNAVIGLAFSPVGHTLATIAADKNTVALWDVANPANPTLLSTLDSHTDVVTAVAFSPDGHVVATGSDDRTARLWDVTDPGQPRQLGDPLTGHSGTVTAVTFSSDGHFLGTYGDDGERLWDLRELAQIEANPLSAACALTHGGLDAKSWASYVPAGVAYQPSCAL
jgi:WD40 repeat protein